MTFLKGGLPITCWDPALHPNPTLPSSLSNCQAFTNLDLATLTIMQHNKHKTAWYWMNKYIIQLSIISVFFYICLMYRKKYASLQSSKYYSNTKCKYFINVNKISEITLIEIHSMNSLPISSVSIHRSIKVDFWTCLSWNDHTKEWVQLETFQL